MHDVQAGYRLVSKKAPRSQIGRSRAYKTVGYIVINLNAQQLTLRNEHAGKKGVVTGL
jgi:hypothetical protein